MLSKEQDRDIPGAQTIFAEVFSGIIVAIVSECSVQVATHRSQYDMRRNNAENIKICIISKKDPNFQSKIIM